MVDKKNESSTINVRRGKCDSLDIYEITAHELKLLKQGSPNSIYLNFAIALISISVSLVSTLLTVELNTDRVFYSFIIVLCVSSILGIIFLILWLIGNNSFKQTIQEIEARIEDEERKDLIIEDNYIVFNSSMKE